METHIPVIERVPITPLPPLSERERIHIAAVTAIAEIQMGADVEITEEDRNIARQIVRDGRRVTKTEYEKPGVILQLEALLTEYDHEVVQDAAQLRTYVTNRLIEESSAPDPRIRMKALELLGKISDVALFSDRKEFVVTHRSEKELEEELRENLSVLLNPEDVIDVEESDSGDGEGPLYEPSIAEIEDELDTL